MLDSLRNFASSWFGKFFLGLLMIGLAGFGISNVILGFGSNTVAQVGSTEISTRDFQRAYQNQLSAVAAQLGTVPTNEQAIQFGIPSSVLQRLTSEAALTELAKRMDLGLSEQKMGEFLREDPSFGGILGEFDRENFSRALQQNGYTETEYLNALRATGMRQQISAAAFGSMPAPDTALAIVNRYTSDTRNVNFFVLSPDTLLPPADPTEEEIATYLSENQTRFRTPPTRKVDVMVLSPEALEQNIEISADEIAAEYERSKANYFTVESRAIKQVVLSSELSQDQFQAGLEAGTPFDQLVESSGLPVSDLGTLSRAAITDDALAETAFSLGEGEFALITAPLGQRAIYVEQINPGGQQTLAEASAEVEARLKSQQARDQYIDVLDQIEEFRAAFRPLTEIADRYGLDITEIDLTASGSELEAVEAIPADDYARVASPVFAAEIGKLAPSIALGANLNVWFDLKEVIEARDQTLDEVRDQVTETILAERTEDQLQETADEAVAALENGESLDNLAIRYNAFPEIVTDVPRNGNGTGQLNASVAAQVFAGPVGHTGAARNATGAYTVFEVTGVNPPDDATNEEPREFVQEALRESTYAAFLSALLADSGSRIDGEALTTLLALE